MGYYPEPYTEILRLFPTEKEVFDLLIQAKTTYCGCCSGFRNMKQSRSNYRYVICRDCKKATSILKHTFLSRTHLDLRIWIYVIYVTLYARHSASCRWIMRELKINSYNTVWKMMHRIKVVSHQTDRCDDNVKILSALKPILAQI